MPDILVRNLEPRTVEELRARATRNHRSVQAELKMIIEDATGSRHEAIARLIKRSDEMREMTRGKHNEDIVDWIREDRESR